MINMSPMKKFFWLCLALLAVGMLGAGVCMDDSLSSGGGGEVGPANVHGRHADDEAGGTGGASAVHDDEDGQSASGEGARSEFRHRALIRSIQRAHEQRAQAEEEARRPPEEPDWAPSEMPRPGTRPTSDNQPTREEQRRFFAALDEQIDPLVSECYANLPEPRPAGTLNLLWTVIYDEEEGSVAERIELDEITELRDLGVLECVRQSILSVELPTLAGYGRLQVTSNHQFDPEMQPNDESSQ